ncbi:MAG: Hpt domain-containing protein [Planctomycetota bacterium]|nr:Hpt domain-containing protein [Planctomycetota bacterium]
MTSPPEDSAAQNLAPLHSERASMDSFLPLLATYVGGFAEQEEMMDRALEQADPVELRTLVHKLKGTGAGYGYPDISAVAGTCEAALIQAGPGGTRDLAVLAAHSELRVLMVRAKKALG